MRNGTPSNSQWSVPGNKVANYVVTYTNETSPSTAVVTELTSQNLTQPTINFYWVDGADSRQVQYSVTVRNRPYTGKITFNVKNPTVTVTSQTHRTTIRQNYENQELLFGEVNPFNPDRTTSGITFTQSGFQMPSGFSGDTFWVQVIDYAFTRTLVDGETTKTASGIGLDFRFPYSSNDPNAAVTADSPGVCLRTCSGASFIKMQTRINAEMWLMFKPKNLPNGNNSIYIPLKKVTWNWTATAVRGEDLQFKLPTNCCTNSVNPSGANTTDFPRWTKVTGNEPFQ